LNAGPSLASIVFNMSGSEVINLQSALPAIQKSVSINSAGVVGIVLDGTNAGLSNGLVFGENTTNISNVSGLTIRNFSAFGDRHPSPKCAGTGQHRQLPRSFMWGERRLHLQW
jgi:hypothetical protein